MDTKKKIILCILDGWGVAEAGAEAGDATRVATYFRSLWDAAPHTQLEASGAAVGLPPGQMGNSEVGHTTIGLGRVIKQDLVRINESIVDGSLARKLEGVKSRLLASGGAAHVWGMISPGGVHSHMDHVRAIVDILAEKSGGESLQVYIHAITDGRDTPRHCGKGYMQTFTTNLPSNAKVVSISGRFMAMDRSLNWDRTQWEYEVLAYQRSRSFVGEWPMVFFLLDEIMRAEPNDEYIAPSLVGNQRYPHNTNDALIIANFRADRLRQLVQALASPDFKAFPREEFPRFSEVLTMTEVEPYCQALFSKQSSTNSLSDVLTVNGFTQVRISEMEKRAHVTYFFDGGVEKPGHEGEYVTVPSPDVISYDQSPQMGAREVTEETVRAVQQGVDVIVVNYANADMIGHTGKFDVTQESIRVVDECLERVVQCAQEHGYTLFVTADHGNAERMQNPDGSKNNTHSTNPVPFMVLDNSVRLKDCGGLRDIAPTILHYLGIPSPGEMTGSSLILPGG
ncbi:MAG: 2,3-bisphosphoglycerate-independent phosphoglycerate mutase [Holosporales bacterium]|jgi:2,3-bisphosphoglycerate-independent phosphoglycerate mutase|nr:2,3-bisphosphoglycerate-independent phosphoglycerate mutase [Holosporales bacterium]